MPKVEAGDAVQPPTRGHNEKNERTVCELQLIFFFKSISQKQNKANGKAITIPKVKQKQSKTRNFKKILNIK